MLKISLLPGEERTYKATFNLNDSKGAKPELKIKAWNVDEIVLKN